MAMASPPQRHHVDAGTEQANGNQSQNQRQRHGQKADEGRAEIQQEEKQDNGNNEAAFEQRAINVVNRQMDEVGLSHQIAFDGDAGRERMIQFIERAIDGIRRSHGVGARLFLDLHDNVRLAVDGAIAALERSADLDRSNVRERHRHSLTDGHHRIGQLLHVVNAPDAADLIFLIGVDEKSGAGVDVGALDGREDVVQRQIVSAKFFRIDQNLELFGVAAEQRDRCHARHRQQSRTHVPIGHGAQFHRADFVALHAQGHNHADRRSNRKQHRGHPGGQPVRGHGQPLGHQLPRRVNVGAPVKRDGNRHDAGVGLRTQIFEMRGAVERLLDGPGDQSFHFRGGHSLNVGLHDDLRGNEIREDIDGHLTNGHDADEKRQERQRNNEGTMLKRPADETVYHEKNENGSN